MKIILKQIKKSDYNEPKIQGLKHKKLDLIK
jgi:hypothetical protein